MQQKQKNKDPLYTRTGKLRMGPLNSISHIEELITKTKKPKEKHRLTMRLNQIKKNKS